MKRIRITRWGAWVNTGRYQIILHTDPADWALTRQGIWPDRDLIQRLPIPVPLYRNVQVGPLEIRRFDPRWPRGK